MARGVTFNVFIDVKLVFEIIVGENVAKSPYTRLQCPDPYVLISNTTNNKYQ